MQAVGSPHEGYECLEVVPVMTYEQLEEIQRRQITQAHVTAREDLTLEVAHLWFWKESPVMGAWPCWAWPYHTQRVIANELQLAL